MKHNAIMTLAAVLIGFALSACSAGTALNPMTGDIGETGLRVTDAGNPDEELETAKTYTKATTVGSVNISYMSSWEAKETSPLDTSFTRNDELVWAAFNIVDDQDLDSYLTEVRGDISDLADCSASGFDSCLKYEFEEDGSLVTEKYMFYKNRNKGRALKNLIVVMTGKVAIDSNWLGTAWFIPVMLINEDLIDDMQRFRENADHPVRGGSPLN